MPVTAVVCAALDDAGEAAVRARITALAAAGLPVRDPPRLRPHITLAAARVDPEELPRVRETAAAVAARTRPFELVLDHLGTFGRSRVLWLGPAPQPALGALQREVDGALVAAGWARAFGPHSEPERWQPHCTLAAGLPPGRRGAALRLAAGPAIATSVTALVTVLVGGSGDDAVFPLG